MGFVQEERNARHPNWLCSFKIAMATEKQIEANRLNAQKSTGPVAPRLPKTCQIALALFFAEPPPLGGAGGFACLPAIPWHLRFAWSSQPSKLSTRDQTSYEHKPGRALLPDRYPRIARNVSNAVEVRSHRSEEHTS